MMSDQYLRSYVKFDEQWFFVSTINRNCSSELAPFLVFSETIVWGWDEENQKRLNMLGEFSSFKGSSLAHFMVINRLLTNGTCDELEVEES